MIMILLRTKPSGLYRHRRGLGLQRVGYKGGDLHICIAKLAFHAKESLQELIYHEIVEAKP